METVVWQSESCNLPFYSYVFMCKCSLLSHVYIIRTRSTVLPSRGTGATLPIAPPPATGGKEQGEGRQLALIHAITDRWDRFVVFPLKPGADCPGMYVGLLVRLSLSCPWAGPCFLLGIWGRPISYFTKKFTQTIHSRQFSVGCHLRNLERLEYNSPLLIIIIKNDTDWQVAIYYSKSLTNMNSFNQSILIMEWLLYWLVKLLVVRVIWEQGVIRKTCRQVSGAFS